MKGNINNCPHVYTKTEDNGWGAFGEPEWYYSYWVRIDGKEQEVFKSTQLEWDKTKVLKITKFT